MKEDNEYLKNLINKIIDSYEEKYAVIGVKFVYKENEPTDISNIEVRAIQLAINTGKINPDDVYLIESALNRDTEDIENNKITFDKNGIFNEKFLSKFMSLDDDMVLDMMFKG